MTKKADEYTKSDNETKKGVESYIKLFEINRKDAGVIPTTKFKKFYQRLKEKGIKHFYKKAKKRKANFKGPKLMKRG